MTGTMSVKPCLVEQSARVECTAEKDGFSLNSCVKHIAREAHYKSLGNGQLVQRGWCNFIRRNLEGNTADDRYHRAAYESSQRNTSAMLAETYRSTVKGATDAGANLADSSLLQSRLNRQDNVRFNPELQQKKTYGLSDRNRWGVKLSRWAQRFNGITELAAAPTGMLLKSSRIALTPERDDRSGVAQVRIMGALTLIAGAVVAFSTIVFGNTTGRIASRVAVGVATDVKGMVGGYSAVAAVSAICSLVCSGVSAICMSKSRIPPRLMQVLENNNQKHINRLYMLLDGIKDTPDAQTLLTKALKSKIGKTYQDADNNGQPILVKRLLADVTAANSDSKLAKESIKNTLGSYLVEKDFTGAQRGDLLGPAKDKAELLRRENHVVGLTNLIEHHRIDKDSSPEYQDFRHKFEGFVKSSRGVVLGHTSNLLNVLGFREQSAKVAHMKTEEYLKEREIRANDPACAHKVKFCMDYMLDHRHQYGWLTRKLLMAAESVRTFNHNVPLSLNYQLTRPIAWLTGRFTEHVLNTPNSRTVSFSIGRALASSMWAVIDALLIIAPSEGRGLGFSGQEATEGTKNLPLKIKFSDNAILPISAVSTAAQMLLISGISFGLGLLATGVAKYIEGWNGNLTRPVEAADSKRKPLQLGNLIR